MPIPVQLSSVIFIECAQRRSTRFELEFIDNDEGIFVITNLDMELADGWQIFNQCVACFLDEEYVEVIIIDFEYQIDTFFLLI